MAYSLKTPHSHLSGSGCSSCAGNTKHTTITFIEHSNKKHNGKYDYSLAEYANKRTKVKIICTEHGFFMQSPQDHLRGNGCQQCKIKAVVTAHTFSRHEFIERCKVQHPVDYAQSASSGVVPNLTDLLFLRLTNFP